MKKKSVKKIISEKNLDFYIDLYERMQYSNEINEFFLEHENSSYKLFILEHAKKSMQEYKILVSSPFFINQKYQWITLSSNVFYIQNNDCFKENFIFKAVVSFCPFADVLIHNLKQSKTPQSKEWHDVVCSVGPYIKSEEAKEDANKLNNSKFVKMLQLVHNIVYNTNVTVTKQVAWFITPTFMNSFKEFVDFGSTTVQLH